MTALSLALTVAVEPSANHVTPADAPIPSASASACTKAL